MTYKASSPKRGSKLKRSTKKGVNNSHCWVNLTTGEMSKEKVDGWHHFDSTLEWKVWSHLRSLAVVLPHFTIELTPPSGQLPSINWQADFYLPRENTIVEVKAPWVNDPKFKTERALFLLQFQLASFDHHAICVSNQAFKIGPIDVIHYSEIQL